MKIFPVIYIGKTHASTPHLKQTKRKQTRSSSISNANARGLPHLERIKVVLETGVVVDAAVVVPEVVINLEGHGDGSRFDQGLQHELFVASSVVSADVDVLADVGLGACGIRVTLAVLAEGYLIVSC